MIALALFIELMVILAGAFVLGKVFDILDERDLRKRQEAEEVERLRGLLREALLEVAIPDNHYPYDDANDGALCIDCFEAWPCEPEQLRRRIEEALNELSYLPGESRSWRCVLGAARGRVGSERKAARTGVVAEGASR